MWISDNWKEYRLLDAEGGERLESWGGHILVRPDPQIIWTGERRLPEWRRADGVYKRSKSGGGKWTVNKMPAHWDISYRDLTFRLRPMGFKHTGLFPEQAANWDWVRDIVERALEKEPEREVRVLNLFAYTGAATVSAAKAGASVCHVDASKGMVTAAKENAALSGLADAPIRYIVDDCMKFVRREIRRGKKYDGIIMDPPSYGRGPGGEVWKLEDCAWEMISESAELLSEDPLFFLINSYTTGLSPATMGYMLAKALPEKVLKAGKLETGETGLPVENSGLVLPAGASARFEAKGKK